MKHQRQEVGREVDPADLEVIDTAGGFALALDGEILLTADGAAQIQHVAAPLLAHIAAEFDGHGSMRVLDRKVIAPRFFGSYALYSIQKAWVEPGKDRSRPSICRPSPERPCPSPRRRPGAGGTECAVGTAIPVAGR